MKKFTAIFLLFFFLAFMPKGDALAASNNHIFIGVNNDLIIMDVPGYLEKGTTYVPIRAFSHLGVQVNWNGKERSVFLKKGKKYATLYVDTNRFITNQNEEIQLSSKIVKGNTMIPYRDISEYFGFHVSFIKEGPVARVMDLRGLDENITEIISDEQFYFIHKEEIDKQKERNKPKKVAYLTFDDGPNGNTATILNILKKYDAKATFFVLEPNVKRNPSIMKRKVQEGHALACHGVTHDKNIVYRNPQSVVNEMKQCQTTIKNVTGVSTNLVRVPYGSVPYMKAPYRTAMKNAGFKMWDWNVDTLDWRYSASQVVSHTIKQVNAVERRGEAPVILLHNLPSSTNALERIIIDLKNRGYDLRALSEDMIAYDFWDKNLQSLKIK